MSCLATKDVFPTRYSHQSTARTMEKPSMSAPEIVFFDAAGTLIHLPRGVAFHYREVALRHGLDLPEDSLKKAFGVAWKTAPPREATRRPRPEDDAGWWRDLVDHV